MWVEMADERLRPVWVEGLLRDCLEALATHSALPSDAILGVEGEEVEDQARPERMLNLTIAPYGGESHLIWPWNYIGADDVGVDLAGSQADVERVRKLLQDVRKVRKVKLGGLVERR